MVYCFGMLLLFGACGKKTENNDTVTSTAVGSYQTDFSGLYTYEQNGDIVKLQLTVENNKANGNLFYALNEKDRNSGTFIGEIKDDILLADYTFFSEGVLSARQISFKLNETTAVEGYGDMEEVDGKMIFKNADSLNYGTGMVLNKK